MYCNRAVRAVCIRSHLAVLAAPAPPGRRAVQVVNPESGLWNGVDHTFGAAFSDKTRDMPVPLKPEAQFVVADGFGSIRNPIPMLDLFGFAAVEGRDTVLFKPARKRTQGVAHGRASRKVAVRRGIGFGLY